MERFAGPCAARRASREMVRTTRSSQCEPRVHRVVPAVRIGMRTAPAAPSAIPRPATPNGPTTDHVGGVIPTRVKHPGPRTPRRRMEARNAHLVARHMEHRGGPYGLSCPPRFERVVRTISRDARRAAHGLANRSIDRIAISPEPRPSPPGHLDSIGSRRSSVTDRGVSRCVSHNPSAPSGAGAEITWDP
jgi:hypothetical protein